MLKLFVHKAKIGSQKEDFISTVKFYPLVSLSPCPLVPLSSCPLVSHEEAS
jgi:hypothetical protein